MADLSSSMVTFLFTDIEGSTRLWEERPDEMREALARHDRILRHAIETQGGVVFKTMGDQFCAAFLGASAALAAALAAQRVLAGSRETEVGDPGAETDAPSPHRTPDPLLPFKVRIALHTGVVEEREGDYFGPPLNRIARLLEAGHGGQILLTLATHELTRDSLPQGVTLRDLGEHRLKDLARPERVFQIVSPELRPDFPPLNSLATRRNTLPAQRTPLIGRDREV